ncbi:glucuronate isomerase [Balneolales bacterium ANBcel1]|nr:glucuronate isomerase [Balneolales bacterium ANBcel1]
MKPFIHDDFLLQTEAAKRLYHEYAASRPIVDFHNHLPPDEINQDKQFENLSEVWLKGDHYKWRAMRTAGVDENVITGDATDREKFFAWARTVPETLKNPLFHWTHLELKRYFGIEDLLNEENAESVWRQTEEMLASPEFSTRNLLKNKNVEVVCTTDDAVDSLEHHRAYMENRSGSEPVMFPTFRPDNAMKIEEPEGFLNYVGRLREVSGVDINDFESFLKALRLRHDYFDTLGCRASDHGIEEPYAEDYTEKEIEEIFQAALKGEGLSDDRIRKFKSAMMHEFALMDYEKGWAFQMHIGALRNNNTRGYRQLGADKGFDSIGDFEIARPLSRFLDRLAVSGNLPRTILYNLNPSDNAVLSTMIGNFMGDGIAGKVQHGPAWWFHDQKEGMEEHLKTLSSMSLLSRFTGMVTDSRSFLSFPRHEYYRRVLCNMLGSDMEQGIVPMDFTMIGDMVGRLCYENALDYFSYKVMPD